MVKKKKSVAKSSKKVTRVSTKVLAAKSPHLMSKNSWFSWFKVGAAVVAFAALAGVIMVNDTGIKQFQASILDDLLKNAALSSHNTPKTLNAPSINSPGILLAHDLQGENEKKLLDIFGTVFPDASVRTVDYQSDEGKTLLKKWKVAELPALFFEKNTFEQEKLSEVVKDLFTLQGGYYSLNVALVNPSGQTRIAGPLHDEGGIWVGNKTAPITVYVYSDVQCQHCRVQERNDQADFKKLIDEGIIRVVYLDLPQNAESMLYSTAMTCLYQTQQDSESYLSLRAKLFDRPNLTKAFTIRELKDAGIDYDTQCHADALEAMFTNRLKLADADGITAVPALYIGKTDSHEFTRFTGDKQFAEYQAVFDHLLGQGVN